MQTKTYRLTSEAKERLWTFIDGASDESSLTKRVLFKEWCEMLDDASPAYHAPGACVATVGMRGKIFCSDLDYEKI